MAEERGPTTGLTPYITIKGGRCSEAADFYARVFSGEVAAKVPSQDGKKLMHCYVRINGGRLMMSDDFPEWRGGVESPDPASFTLHLQVDDADAWFRRALDAGCEEKMKLEDQFWGDRYGQVRDPFGVSWSIASSPKG
jgi:PhnB protein